MDRRLRIVGIFYLVLALMLIYRLFYWQVVQNETLAAQARAQQTSSQHILAPRGTILASDGTWLAANRDSWLLYAFLPDFDGDSREVANKLAPLVAEKPDDRETVLAEAMRLEGQLLKTDTSWVPLARRLSTDTKKNIEALNVAGLGFDQSEARYYPEASNAAHILGFVGKDDEGNDKGYFGLEGYYDLTLAGKPGYVERESNALGAPLLTGKAKEVTALRGVDLQTHIDKRVQFTIEKELREGIERYGAVSGTIIIIDPQDGGVLGMASLPSYDPLTYYDFSTEVFKNPAISDTFEPGSVFKPIVMASGIDAKVVEPDTRCDVCDKPYPVDKYFIKTWDNQYHADSTMTEVIMHSDNVGMTFVGMRLGRDRMYDYLSKFGFGSLTGIDLQGETASSLRKKGTWSLVDLATASFGQGIAVTPIQLVNAIVTIARDGVPVTPQVVNSLSLEGWEEDIEPQEGERVISKEAADKITDMMVSAAAQGEAKWAIPKGFKVAGKTGTAQIPVAGHYDEDKTIASFVGFAPPENPKFVMLVTLREPTSSPWASETAAPLWFSIAKNLFPYFGIRPEG